ncbi:MAG: hypothetical protein EBV69_12800 [Oxalobacteraceae bacterium]|nr:hypothetical protein [Oxalobacteraceae bacterium]
MTVVFGQVWFAARLDPAIAAGMDRGALWIARGWQESRGFPLIPVMIGGLRRPGGSRAECAEKSLVCDAKVG